MFVKGEIVLKTDVTRAEYDNQFKILKAINLSFYTVIDYACHYQGRDDLMNFKPYAYLETQDFRFAKDKRAIIFKQINENENQSYYDFSLKQGLDLARFYK